MYEYKFVKINLRGALPPKKPMEDYHKVIEERVEIGTNIRPCGGCRTVCCFL